MKDQMFNRADGATVVSTCAESRTVRGTYDADDRAPHEADRKEAVAHHCKRVPSSAPTNARPIAHQLDRAMRILRIKQLMERTMLSRATLYGLMSNDPSFPRRFKLTARSVGWLESEVDAWIVARAESRNAE